MLLMNLLLQSSDVLRVTAAVDDDDDARVKVANILHFLLQQTPWVIVVVVGLLVCFRLVCGVGDPDHSHRRRCNSYNQTLSSYLCLVVARFIVGLSWLLAWFIPRTPTISCLNNCGSFTYETRSSCDDSDGYDIVNDV